MIVSQDAVWAQDAGSADPALNGANYVRLILECRPWGPVLLILSFTILAVIVFCTMGTGQAYRSGSRHALDSLPARLDADGLIELRDQEESRQHPSGPLRRALRVGLVAGRGGLLISKSAVVAAWESEKTAFELWPRIMVSLGITSLALGMLAAIYQLPEAIQIWRSVAESNLEFPSPKDMVRYLDLLNQAHALLFWGFTNFFIALVLYFVFERIIHIFLNRTTLALIRYLGDSNYGEAASFAAAEEGKETN